MIDIQTEFTDVSIRDLFNVHSDVYEGSELKILLQGAEESHIIVHKLVVMPKCKFNLELIKDNTFDAGIYSSVYDTDGLIHFFKLLYGFKLHLTFNDLYALFTVARALDYIKLDGITKTLESSVEGAPTDTVLKMLSDLDFSKMRIMEKLPLKVFTKYSGLTENPEILRLFIEESIHRYGKTTKSLQVHIETLSRKNTPPFDRTSELLAGLFGNYK